MNPSQDWLDHSIALYIVPDSNTQQDGNIERLVIRVSIRKWLSIELFILVECDIDGCTEPAVHWPGSQPDLNIDVHELDCLQ